MFVLSECLPAVSTRRGAGLLIRLCLLLVLGLPVCQAQVPNLFGDDSASTAELPELTDLPSDWYLYLTEADPDAYVQAADELLAHVRELAQAIPEDVRPAELAQDLTALANTLAEWKQLQAQVQSPVTAPVADNPEATLAAYLALGDQRNEAGRQIAIVKQRLDDLERQTREHTLRLDGLTRDYRATEQTSPARFRLGVQRMTARTMILNAGLRSDARAAELARLEQRQTARNTALNELAARLQPQADDNAALPECGPADDSMQTDNLLDEVDAISRQSCGVLRGLLLDWQQMGGSEVLASSDIENIELRRNRLAKIRTRLPELRGQLERQLLAQASTAVDSAEFSLGQLRSGLEQLTAAADQANRARLMLELIDLQQLQGASGLARFWYSVRDFAGSAWDGLYQVLKVRLFAIGDSIVTPLSILRVLFIVWLGWWISRLFRGGVNRFALHRFAGGESAAWYTLSRIGHYIIIIAAILIGLASIGLDLSNLAIIAGALSVGIGFGLQSIVSNFVSGLILLFERSIKIGDYIDLEGGITGQVQAINTRFTRINTNDNIDILVPNSELVSNRLINWTMHEDMRRLHVPFGVAYGSDKELVQKAALEAADQVSYTVKDFPNREPEVWLVEFGDSSLNFELLIWLRDGVKRPARVVALYLWELETMLKKYDIEIPFPQRDLHLRTGFDKPYFSQALSGENPEPEPAPDSGDEKTG